MTHLGAGELDIRISERKLSEEFLSKMLDQKDQDPKYKKKISLSSFFPRQSFSITSVFYTVVT